MREGESLLPETALFFFSLSGKAEENYLLWSCSPTEWAHYFPSKSLSHKTLDPMKSEALIAPIDMENTII